MEGISNNLQTQIFLNALVIHSRRFRDLASCHPSSSVLLDNIITGINAMYFSSWKNFSMLNIIKAGKKMITLVQTILV